MKSKKNLWIVVIIILGLGGGFLIYSNINNNSQKSENKTSENTINENKTSENSNQKINTTKAELKDTAIITYVGKVAGKTFEGGTSQGEYPLTLGSHSFVDNFEEQIVGHKIGETFDVKVTFPKEYQENLAGKKAVFTVSLKGLMKSKNGKIYGNVSKELKTQLEAMYKSSQTQAS